jgi:hypothetical protein
MAQLAGNQASTKKLEEKLKFKNTYKGKQYHSGQRKVGDQLFNCS